MKTNKFLFIIIVVLTVLAIALLAATITGTASAADDCPGPLRPQVWLPLVGQAHIAGMIDCIQHPYKCLDK